MKKYLVAFFVLISLSTASKAQYSSNWVGVRLGANFGGESIDSTYDNATNSLKFGILGGAQFDHWFDDNWGVGIGLLFDQKGTSELYAQASVNNQVKQPDGNYITYSGNDNYTLNYLEIPIVFKAAFGDGDVKPYLFAGPSIGILLSASDKTDNNIPPVTNLKTYLNSTDISIYFGGGFLDKLNTNEAFFFDAGYSAGLTKIYKTAPDRTPLPLPVQHLTSKSGDIRITVGMMWAM